MKFDTVVLGGGVVGVSVALQLQMRGRAVALVDRKAPGNETSLGNAGLIQREGVYPYAFPRDLGSLLRYAGNRANDVRYHPGAMPSLLPFLYRYWHNSRDDRHTVIASHYSALIAHCVTEHQTLARASGVEHMLRPGGWTKIFRTEGALASDTKAAERWQAEFGIAFDTLDDAALKRLEPALQGSLAGGLRFPDAMSVGDPSALVAAYARHFEALGGRVLIGDAMTLAQTGQGWTVDTQAGRVQADGAVIATGPWSDVMTERLGYRLPLRVKRGYHMHYKPLGTATLSSPVLDAENGYMITPMARGIRLTTGVELGRVDAPKTPLQLEAVEPTARALFPLGERVDAEPWLGRRPCTPDMMPVIGPAHRHEKLWFAFGHAHHGLTLGPVTGRVIAEMITGTDTVVDARPFDVKRFF